MNLFIRFYLPINNCLGRWLSCFGWLSRKRSSLHGYHFHKKLRETVNLCFASCMKFRNLTMTDNWAVGGKVVRKTTLIMETYF